MEETTSPLHKEMRLSGFGILLLHLVLNVNISQTYLTDNNFDLSSDLLWYLTWHCFLRQGGLICLKYFPFRGCACVHTVLPCRSVLEKFIVRNVSGSQVLGPIFIKLVCVILRDIREKPHVTVTLAEENTVGNAQWSLDVVITYIPYFLHPFYQTPLLFMNWRWEEKSFWLLIAKWYNQSKPHASKVFFY